MSKQVLFLIAGVSALWLLLALPARYLGGGDNAVWQSGLAALLCLVPATASLVWATWAFGQGSDQQLYAVLGGGGVRLIFVTSAALILTEVVGLFKGQTSFFLWLGVFYVLTLALEIGLLLMGRSKTTT